MWCAVVTSAFSVALLFLLACESLAVVHISRLLKSGLTYLLKLCNGLIIYPNLLLAMLLQHSLKAC